jgi:signal transduction histidine kinase
MDSKNFPHNEHFEQLKSLFAVKYGSRKPALVLTLDNPAFEFAIKYRQALFKGVPVIFAGLNDFEPAMLKGERGVTGVMELQDFVGTLKLARQLQPDVREVVFLHDFTSSGLASRKESEEQLAPLATELKFRYLPEMTIEEIAATVRGLQPGSVVLPFSFSRDKAGKVFNHSQLAKILGSNSTVPVYGTKEERLGYGIIGGSLLEGKSHGALGAELALRVLRGEDAAAIPIVTRPLSRVMLDYNMLKKYKIDLERLPADSTVINRTPGLYRQHALVLNVAGGIILMLVCCLVLLMAVNRRRIRAEEAQLEAERSRSRVLETANREMESFCYAVSHDLQAPLRHIQSYITIIDEECGDRVDAATGRYLQRIKGAVSRMSRLISDLLMLSRSAMAEVNCQEFDLGELAREVFALRQLQEGSRKIEFAVDAGGLRVTADRTLVRTVLENLLDNACKFTATTAAAVVRLGVRAAGGRRVYYIADNGIGFDMQYAEKLFAPFQRLHPDDEFTGNGIGLAIVQRIVNRHGGQIWAESRPGAGATFFFTLEP